MASDDFLQFSGFEAQITALISAMNRAKGDVDANSEMAAEEAAAIIKAEQQRLLAKASFKRDKKSHRYGNINGSLIKITRDKRTKGKVYKLCVGYDTPTLREHPELLVIEFGRPGSSARHMSKKDTLGRTKGDFPPHISHIRAGYFLAKDKAVQHFNEKLLDIVKSDFES